MKGYELPIETVIKRLGYNGALKLLGVGVPQ